MAVDAALADRLNSSLSADLAEEGRLGKVRRYLEGEHDLPYMPRGAQAEYRHMAKRAITNWTPLISDTFAKSLFVDGYRAASEADNTAAWDYWQANGLDARQTVAHRGALEYGTSYTLVLPGKIGAKRIPVIRPLSPLRSAAWYQDSDDEFPEIALRRMGRTVDGADLIQLLDKSSVYTFAKPKDDDGWVLSKAEDHGLGVTPFVRFRDRLDAEARGIIRPIIPLQDRINEVSFSTLIALQYASFRQRWATGLAIPVDEETEQPVEPFRAAVDRLWVAEDENVKFGDFAQTEMSGHAAAYTASIHTLAAVSQINPTLLTGELVNISADALAALQDTTERKVGEYETIFGESWESALRLGSRAAGDTTAAANTDAQVRWRDTEARAFTSTVQGLAVLASQLQVPVEELWTKIPGVTDQDVVRWKAARSQDPLALLTQQIAAQSTTGTSADPNAAAPGSAPAAGQVPAPKPAPPAKAGA